MSEQPSMIETDFAVLEEDYSRYQVQDGTVLRVKIVVRKILRTPVITPQGYPAGVFIDSLNSVAAIVPQHLKREPTREPWNPATDVGKEMKFDPMEEKWQAYMTTEGYKVLVKPIVTKVIKYEKYNDYGEPVYATTVQAVTNVEKLTSTATP
jgi:hypothetical protein